MTIILGIESTCDETAASIIKECDDGRVSILSNIISSQQNDHAEYGGVVPELAARAHLTNIRPVVDQAFKQAGILPSDVDAIAASYAPGLIGGILIGNLFAKTICSALKKPFIAINHLEAHILMPLMNNSNIRYPFLAVLMSGGNTYIALVRDFHKYEILSKTLDDSIGETFDKIALMLGMPYPGGPLIEKLAKFGDPKAITLPMPLCGTRHKFEKDFSFSGLKTSVKLLIERQERPLSEDFRRNLCASLQETIAQILIIKINNALNNVDVNTFDIVVSGGVAANAYLRNALVERFNDHKLHFPPNSLCTDNGVMIGWNGLLKYKKGFFETLDSKITS